MDGLGRISHLSALQFSSRSIEFTGDSEQAQYTLSEGSKIGSDYGAVTVFKEEQERGVNDELYDQLEQAMAKADSSKRDAFEESIRRRKAERDAMDARRKVSKLGGKQPWWYRLESDCQRFKVATSA
ncbi:hypothetical protein Tco_0746984 [Tanacetum coccineum]